MKKNYRNKYKKENILQHLNGRSIGFNGSKPSSIENLEKYLPYFWKKRVLETEKHNKIFASQWVNNDSVVYGTKCNKLYWLNVDKGTSFEIPLIEGISRKDQQNAQTNEPSTNFGIHAIKKNYTETLLATGAENVNSVGIYKMPEFQPMTILENFHSDAIFDICWLDDSHVATCSRDSKMGIWCINGDINRPHSIYFNRCLDVNDRHDVQENVVNVYHKPITQMCLDYATNRFRAMEYLQSTNRLLIATMSNKLYSLDPVRSMEESGNGQIVPFKTAIQEMVAIRRWPAEPHSFAVGGQARFAIYDSRKQGEAMNVLALNQSAGIRSLAFKDAVISYGTAEGHINFFDLRAKQHLDASCVGGGDLPSQSGPSTRLSALSHCSSSSQSSLPSSSFSTTSPSSSSSLSNYHCWPSSALSSHNRSLLQLHMEGVFEQSDLGRPVSHNQTAIYSHEYDPTRTKLFAAGGPIAACHSGQAACLFE